MDKSGQSSRRWFLGSGLALANVASASRLAEPGQKPSAPAPEPARPGAGLRYGVLGKTGLKVTRLGFGCLAVADSSVISRAMDMGINFFDTARSYMRGNSERMLGVALKGRRKDVILETKSTAPSREAALQE